MKTAPRTCAFVAAATAALAGTVTSAEAAQNPTNYIVGGQIANDPAIVQLSFGQGGNTYGCTGELISDQWVLTAQHCTDGDDWMNVYLSNSTGDRGPAHAADRLVASPRGDVALVHLAKPVKAPRTVRLAESYQPKASTSGSVYGYGLRANRQPADHLYEATVNVLGSSTDAYGGRAIHVKGVSGASNHGDSGGPLVVNGVVVGVCSTGDSADPGADTQAGSNYANLTDSRSWIRQTAGV